MAESGSSGLDVLGIKPVATAIEKVTTAAVDGFTASVSVICRPAAEEFGLFLKDIASGWRQRNAVSLERKLKQKLAENKVPENATAHPRIVHEILEKGTWNDDATVQDLWAGLLSSSCTSDGDDDSNLVFVGLLDGLTKMQARLLKYACEQETKFEECGLIFARQFAIALDEVWKITGEKDFDRLDRELDNLRNRGLLTDASGIKLGSAVFLTPSPLGLHMYVRCQGSRSSPLDYFNCRNVAQPVKQPQPALEGSGT
jgi:hypothetical protein